MKAKFFVSQKVTITAGATIRFLGVTTDAPYVSFYPDAVSSSEHPLEISFYRNPTVSDNGTPVTPEKKNQSSLLTPKTLAFFNPTVTTSGTLITSFPIFTEKHVGGVYKNGSNSIGLEQETSYLYEIKNLGNGPTDAYIHFDWTEVQS